MNRLSGGRFKVGEIYQGETETEREKMEVEGHEMEREGRGAATKGNESTTTLRVVG